MEQENFNWTIILKDKELPKNFQELIDYCHSKNWMFSYPPTARTLTIRVAKKQQLLYDYTKQKLEIQDCGLDENGTEVVKSYVKFENISTDQVCIIAEGFLVRKSSIALIRLKEEISYFKRTKDALINKYHFDADGDIIRMYNEDIANREQRLKELGGIL